MENNLYKHIDVALTALLEAKAEIIKYNLSFSKAMSELKARQFKTEIYKLLYPDKPHQAIDLLEEDMPTITLKTGSLRKRADGLFEVRFYVAKKRYSVYDKSADGCVKSEQTHQGKSPGGKTKTRHAEPKRVAVQMVVHLQKTVCFFGAVPRAGNKHKAAHSAQRKKPAAGQIQTARLPDHHKQHCVAKSQKGRFRNSDQRF